MNKFIAIGNLTRDVESGTTASGVSYAKFTIAVNRKMSKDKEVDYFNIVAWRGLADNCAKYLSKGKKVCVSGSIQFGEYTTKSGEKRQTTDVNADEVEFLSPNESRTTQPTQATQHKLQEVDDDSLPF